MAQSHPGPHLPGSHLPGHNLPKRRSLHPVIYAALVGSLLWIILAGWTLIGRDRYMDYLLIFITVLMTLFVGATFLISGIWRHRSGQAERVLQLKDWIHSRLETATGLIDARQATFLVLLPPVAVALSIMIILLIAHFNLPGSS